VDEFSPRGPGSFPPNLFVWSPWATPLLSGSRGGLGVKALSVFGEGLPDSSGGAIVLPGRGYHPDRSSASWGILGPSWTTLGHPPPPSSGLVVRFSRAAPSRWLRLRPEGSEPLWLRSFNCQLDFCLQGWSGLQNLSSSPKLSPASSVFLVSRSKGLSKGSRFKGTGSCFLSWDWLLGRCSSGGWNGSPEGGALWRRAGLVPARSSNACGFLLEQNPSACLSQKQKTVKFSVGLGLAEALGTGEALASLSPAGGSRGARSPPRIFTLGWGCPPPYPLYYNKSVYILIKGSKCMLF
jgi:hypothetical protein